MKVVIHYKNGQLLFSSSNEKETMKAVKVVSKWCNKMMKEFTIEEEVTVEDEFFVIVEKGFLSWKIYTNMKSTYNIKLLKMALEGFLRIFN
jgi:hypothetical protein